MTETGDLISRIYGGFRGVDFRGEEINLARSPDSLNVWKDYKETESIRTRPGMKLDTFFDYPIYGIFFYKGVKLIHSGTKLYKVENGTKTAIFTGLDEKPSNAFVYENIWYFKDGKNYVQYDGSNIKRVSGYIPTTSIARKPVKNIHTDTFTGDGKTKEYELQWGNISTDYEPTVTVRGVFVAPEMYSIDYEKGKITFTGTAAKDDTITVKYKRVLIGGGGTIHEDVNMLSDYRINTFLADGESTDYCLDVEEIDNDYTPVVKVNDKVVSNYTVFYGDGNIKAGIVFKNAPAAPLTDGQDNVSIQFKKAVSGYREKILNCSLLQVFDNRVFVSGNKDYPNTVWHCSLNDPSYFSDLDYYREGIDSAEIKGLVAGNNALWVFREPSESNTNVFYHTPTIDDEYGKIYPSSHSSVTIGCVGRAINFNDDIVFFSIRGMEGISGDITTEQAVGHRSSLVDRKLIASPGYKEMILEEWEGYLFAFIGNKVFLADSRTAFANENHIEYEWFYWELDKKIICAKVNDGVLYLGTANGVYTLTAETDEDGEYIVSTDNGKAIESYWVTPKDKFTSPHKQKTTNKRGCVVEATGDITLYVKTDKTEFELIGTYENITDSFTSRIKRKKWKDIQLKFHSNTRFSLETATLEAFIGGYIKR